MARRARSGRNTQSQAALAPVAAFINRKLPHFDPLDEETIVKLEGQVNWIIQDVGIAFRDDPQALDLCETRALRLRGTSLELPRIGYVRSVQKRRANLNNWLVTPNARS